MKSRAFCMSLSRRTEDFPERLEEYAAIWGTTKSGANYRILNEWEKLSGMDSLMAQIEDIENKIEKFRPKTQEEKVELRKLDSGPYNQSLVDFWDDSQDKFEAQGKQEYILTPEDVDNFSDTDIKKSFDASDY